MQKQKQAANDPKPLANLLFEWSMLDSSQKETAIMLSILRMGGGEALRKSIEDAKGKR